MAVSGQLATAPLPRLSDRYSWVKVTFAGGPVATASRRKRSPDHASGSGSIRPKSERVSPSKGLESGPPKLPQPVKVGHPGRANKAVPAGWIRRIVDARFVMQ